MNDVLQRVAYLKGLTDGLKIDTSSDEGKVLAEIIDVLDLMAENVDDINYRQSLIVEDLDEIDEDLADLEDYVYDTDLDLYDYPNLDDFDFDDFDDEYLDDYDLFDEEHSPEADDEDETIDI